MENFSHNEKGSCIYNEVYIGLFFLKFQTYDFKQYFKVINFYGITKLFIHRVSDTCTSNVRKKILLAINNIIFLWILITSSYKITHLIVFYSDA